MGREATLFYKRLADQITQEHHHMLQNHGVDQVYSFVLSNKICCDVHSRQPINISPGTECQPWTGRCREPALWLTLSNYFYLCKVFLSFNGTIILFPLLFLPQYIVHVCITSFTGKNQLQLTITCNGVLSVTVGLLLSRKQSTDWPSCPVLLWMNEWMKFLLSRHKATGQFWPMRQDTKIMH